MYLDVGCAAGLLGKAIKNCRKDAEIYGIEFNPEYARQAEHYLNGVVCGDVEKIDLQSIGKKFDCIIYADILEHLKDPWTILRTHRSFLTREGSIAVSIPNIQFIGILLSLLFGNWNYTESGILDKTHLRFFTKKTLRKLMDDTGFEIEVIRPNYSDHKSVAMILRTCALFGLFANFFTKQFMVIAKPKDR